MCGFSIEEGFLAEAVIIIFSQEVLNGSYCPILCSLKKYVGISNRDTKKQKGSLHIKSNQ